MSQERFTEEETITPPPTGQVAFLDDAGRPQPTVTAAEATARLSGRKDRAGIAAAKVVEQFAGEYGFFVRSEPRQVAVIGCFGGSTSSVFSFSIVDDSRFDNLQGHVSWHN